jgi:hypothetical protein
MAEQQRRDRGRGHAGTPRDEPRDQSPPLDPGAYIGRLPERATETIPGGVGRKDVRVSAVATQPAPVSGSTSSDAPRTPEGHREGANATDSAVREAGQNR